MAKQFFQKLCAVCALALLCGCGPKEIGQGYSGGDDLPPEAMASDQMRYPMTGASRTEQFLYYYNRMDVMQNLHKNRMAAFQRKMGINPESPEYRAIPKQRSPFRQ